MRKVSLKFIFLLVASLTLMSCGKEIEDVKKGHIENRELELGAQILTINYQNSSLAPTEVTISRNALFKIPEKFSFIADTEITQALEIIYNKIAGTLHYEFRCVYFANNEEALFHLNSCYDEEGRSLGDASSITLIDFMLDAGRVISIESSGPQSFSAIIHHQVDWK